MTYLAERGSVREHILIVARGEFARHGYKGASIRRITAKAKVNLGAINYHFQRKELLYTSVLQALVGPLASKVRFAALADVAPLEKVERVVRALFEHIRRNPDMPAIVMRELSSGEEMPGPIKNTFGQMVPLLVGIIQEGQTDGSIRTGDPVLLALSSIAQPIYLNLARPLITSVAGVDPQDERVIEHVVAVVRAALLP